MSSRAEDCTPAPSESTRNTMSERNTVEPGGAQGVGQRDPGRAIAPVALAVGGGGLDVGAQGLGYGVGGR